MATTNEGLEPHELDPMLLARFLSGETTAEESARVERWMRSDVAHRRTVDAMREAWERPAAAEFDADDAVWRRIKARVEAPDVSSVLVAEDMGRRAPRFEVAPARFRWIAAAAAVVVLAAGALGGRAWLARRAAPEGVASPAAREVVTRRGERAVLDLADGSRVVLAAGSRLKVPKDLGARAGQPRDLELEGEAYFEVVHDSTRPFRVHTAAGVAEDIGTEYIVSTYPEIGGMRVVVASGAVVLRLAGTRAASGAIGEPGRALLTLGPRDLATLDSTGTATIRRHVDPASYLAWTSGTLVFDGTPLREALPALGRWYDADLRLADPSLGDRKLTATFRDEPIAQVLHLVSISLDLAVDRRGNTATLRARSR